MTVLEELTLSQQHSIATDYWTDERIQTPLENLHLNHLTEHVVYPLSGGQQKKLQVLSMLIMWQPILLLDEPLAGLDIDSVITVMTLINQSIHETDQSVLMISHQRAGLADFIDY